MRRSEAGAGTSLRKSSKKLTAAVNEAVQYFSRGTRPEWAKVPSFTPDQMLFHGNPIHRAVSPEPCRQSYAIESSNKA